MSNIEGLFKTDGFITRTLGPLLASAKLCEDGNPWTLFRDALMNILKSEHVIKKHKHI
jgi:hypothetical protein